MKKLVLALSGLALLLSFIIPEVYAKSRKAKITFKRGIVQVQKRGSKRWINYNPAIILVEGDKVRAKKKSKAEIRFDDGSRIQLLSNSTIVLKKYSSSRTGRQSNVKLNKGSLFASVRRLKRKSTFQVTAVNTTAGVRGTEFYVSIDKKENVTVEVNTGVIEVEAENKKVIVRDLQGTIVKKGNAPRQPKTINRRNVKWVTK
jgi:ferric-dicitrate binding protein FerR (iron transport regulator)